MSEEIVVDCKAVIEWLESRRKLDKDWVNQLKGIQLKYKDIIAQCKEKPYPKIKTFIEEKEKDFNYLDLVKLLELFKDTPEAESKNMFGSYNSKLLKEIVSLIKVLEKNNLHIADVAKQLSHLANFEGPSILKVKQTSDGDRKQFQIKKDVTQNGISRARDDIKTFLNKNSLVAGQIDQSIANSIFELPQKIDNFVRKVQSTNLWQCLDHYYRMAGYLNPDRDGSDLAQKLPHIEFLLSTGDGLMEQFEQFKKTLTPVQEKDKKSFDYAKYFNKKGFYKVNLNPEKDKAADSKENNWGIEEVVDLSSSYSQWQIVEEPQQAAVSAIPEVSVILNQEFRDALNAEIEELIYFFQERQLLAKSATTILMFDKKLASLANEMTTEQISKAILSLQEAQNGLNEPSFRQLLSFLDSDKAKERIHSNLAALEGVEKRKERQLWKLDENIKELKASSEDAADNIVQINRKITFLSTAIEDLLGKNIKRKVTITRTTF